MQNKLLNGIKTYNKALSLPEVMSLREKILETPLLWAGINLPGHPVNTLKKFFRPNDEMFIRLQNVLFNHEPRLKLHKFERAGINVIMPQTDPQYFHPDGDNIITALFYINPKFDLQEGGDTQFDLGDYILGIKSEPGKLIIFDGKIEHRATYFRKNTRITAYLKYFKDDNINLFE
jgi:hypothetical protein